MICDGKATLDIRRLWCKDISALVQDDVRIPISRTPGPFGGMRNWFLCPQCDRRCVLLYGNSYVCRICARGRYRSELASPRQRRFLRAQKTRRKLGQSTGGLVAPFPDKPKSMHWATYLKIRGGAAEIEQVYWREELRDIKVGVDQLEAAEGYSPP